ncbi:MAG: S8 family serine peptidase [Solirubrobacteraceae bacterium]
MRRSVRVLPTLALAVAVAALAGYGAAGAGAYPVSRHLPKVLLRRSSAPTIAECEAEFKIACYQPKQIEKAYNLPELYAQGDEGQGQTIVIVDSFGSPTAEHDLSKFDKIFKLPEPPSFKIIQPAGAVRPFEKDNVEMAGWAFETDLDIEYSHAIAPKADILLVETPEEETEGVQGFPQIVAAENYVIEHHLGEVISQSFSATEESFPSHAAIFALRSAYENAATHGVTVLDAAGDEGTAGVNQNEEFLRHRAASWPATDPLVTGIGGTMLHLNEAGERTSPDTVWDDIPYGIDASGGGGPSHVFELPAFQKLVDTHSGDRRATPDISMSAAVNGGVLVLTGYKTEVPEEPAPNTLTIVGGTSEATPLFSGVIALADQIAGHSLGDINQRLYELDSSPFSGIVDITEGENPYVVLGENEQPLFTVPGYQAKKGYDMASGLGTVNGYVFAHALAGH